MISNNYIPEKINDANAYLDGTRMIGVAASVDLPEINMKTGTVEGFEAAGYYWNHTRRTLAASASLATSLRSRTS